MCLGQGEEGQVDVSTLTATVAVVIASLSWFCATVAQAAPVKLILSSHIGAEVDRTTGGSICLVASKDECQVAHRASSAGGFDLARGVAGGATGGGVYVTDGANFRVQEFAADGKFVLMFGQKVNRKGGDVCTQAEVGECQVGGQASTAGGFGDPGSIAVDPSTGNVYVLDRTDWRVDEYSAGGQFILTFGKEVNRQGGDVCTEAELAEGQSGTPEGVGSDGPYDFASGADLFSVGGAPEHLLYVGEEHHVQDFNEAGEAKGEVKLPTSVIGGGSEGQISAVAIDAASGAILWCMHCSRLSASMIRSREADSESSNYLPEKLGNASKYGDGR